ncbi:MAG: beta-N-acetylhexosaminidase, partial [Bacteroides sp.]
MRHAFKSPLMYLCMLLFVLSACQGKETTFDYQLIPMPNELVAKPGYFVLDNDKPLYVSSELLTSSDSIINSFVLQLKNASGYAASAQSLAGNEALPEKGILFVINKELPEEAYTLSITNNRVLVEASTRNGLFYAIQTIKQLLPVSVYGGNSGDVVEWTLPCTEIKDAPRFAYRGMMIDVARHFFPVEEMKRIINVMSIHKLNTLHWHLTDDQGWRIEIKKYPLLTQVGSKRTDTQVGGFGSEKRAGCAHEGYYTQEEVKEIIAYAKARHIKIVPEIEMPGHASASIAAYPWLGTKNEKIDVPIVFGKHYHTYNVIDPKVQDFLEDVISEVLALFKTDVIHIGGDEVRFNHWEEDEKMVAYK